MKPESPCYKINRGVNSDPAPLDNLRLETSPACFYLLPYHHLDIAKFESARERDSLTITFLNHQVRIVGRDLRELAVAIQNRAVEFIKPMPSRYGAAMDDQDGLVESISIEDKIEQS
ncbi:MAG TPA: hypothetical protein VMA13_08715 [Candidatus Saccharimonadales bacterium]|nr:hypothetical protein [Candidatus Saccharimonadales bacterium]